MNVSDWIEETKRTVLSGQREPMNYIVGAHDASVTAIHFGRELGAIASGAVVSVGLELMYVWSIDGQNRIANVQRGYWGSSPQTHADGDLVIINPKFADFSIMKALDATLTDMSARGVFRVAEHTFTYIPNRVGYDLTGATTVIDQLDCRYDYPGPERSWPLLRNFEIRRNSDTAQFPSTYQIILREGAYAGRDVRVTYATNFVPLTSLTQTHTQVGLPDTATDIPALGAAVRLQSMREAKRNFDESNPDPRRSAEVGTGAQLQGVRGFQAIYTERVQTEAIRLQKAYPHRRKVL